MHLAQTRSSRSRRAASLSPPPPPPRARLSVLHKDEPASPQGFPCPLSDPLHPQGSDKDWPVGQALLCVKEVDFPGTGSEGLGYGEQDKHGILQDIFMTPQAPVLHQQLLSWDL